MKAAAVDLAEEDRAETRSLWQVPYHCDEMSVKNRQSTYERQLNVDENDHRIVAFLTARKINCSSARRPTRSRNWLRDCRDVFEGFSRMYSNCPPHTEYRCTNACAEVKSVACPSLTWSLVCMSAWMTHVTLSRVSHLNIACEQGARG